MFDFRLKVFYTVARRLNFTKAAEELLISQPAVTKHIKELESQFNLALFDRRGNKVVLKGFYMLAPALPLRNTYYLRS